MSYNKINISASKEELYQMYVVERKAMWQIGKIFGCSRDVITRILKENNIEIRNSKYLNSLPKKEKKVCIKCKEEKSLKEFNKYKRSRDGHSGKCTSCRNEFKRGRYKEYKKTKKYQDISKEYRSSERGKEVQKRATKKYRNGRTKRDPLYKLSMAIRNAVIRAFKRNGFKKTSKTAEILGCSFQEFKTHIESKWENWMMWENHGKYNGKFNFGWDIDHIIPLSSAKTEEELIKLCHFSNIQPLCSYVNRDIKKDKLNFIRETINENINTNIN